MRSRSESAGMSQPSSVTPSIAGKNTSSYSSPYSSGHLRIGVRAECAISSARPLMNSSVVGGWMPGAVVGVVVVASVVGAVMIPDPFYSQPQQPMRPVGHRSAEGFPACRAGTLLDDLAVGQALE